MSTLSPLKNSSIEALLSLLLDGKQVSDLDLADSVNSLEAITDERVLIEELYLLSMYFKIQGKEGVSLLKNQIERIQKALEEFDLEDFSNKILFYKFCFSKVLIGMEIKAINKGESLAKIENLKNLDNLAIGGSLLFFMGIMLSNSDLYQDGILVAELIFDLINENGEVDAFFFFEKGAYKKDSCRGAVYILLSLYSFLTKDFKGGDILRKIDPYEGGLFQSLGVETRLLCRLVEMVKPFGEAREKIESKKFISKDLIKLNSDKFSYITSTDKKVGVGSISYENTIVIPSFGPHVLPLGRNDLYGMNDPVSKDYEIYTNQVKMWNKVKSKSEYGDHWIFTSVTNEQDKMVIESFIWSNKKEESLSLIFFLRGKKIFAGGKSFQSKGLERALVKTNKIEIELENKKMQIQLKDNMEVEIIPLAGQQYFWESDFIVSLPFQSNKIMLIDLLMD
jgi:hypothetical protein